MRLLILFGLAFPAPLYCADVRAAHSTARLVPEFTTIAPGQEFRVALWIRPDPSWHTYWRNTGDSGSAPILKWRKPEAVSLGAPSWPFPERLRAGPLVNYGYAGELFLIVPGKVSTRAEGVQRLDLAAEWLVCQEECLPASGRFSLELPVRQTAKINPAWQAPLARAEPRLPRAAPGWRLSASIRGAEIALSAKTPGGARPRALEFFPYEPLIIDNAADQRLEAAADGWTLRLKAAGDAAAPPRRLAGVVVVDRDRAYEVDAPLDAGGMIAVLALAFAGGLLLNLMPCVFPVLSIKVLSFVEHARDGRARSHGLAFAAGVLASFWGLAGLLLLLRAQGERIGWGFQLQSPSMLVALAALFVALGLNMLDVFEFGARLTRLGGLAAGAGGLRGSFLSGMLATIVATPCTAPFMGSAIGAALALPAASAFGAFTALALGMSLPYVALTFYPAGLRLLPRPGPWMRTLKRALSIPLFATSLWLLWVLGQQLGPARASDTSAGWERYSDQTLERHLASGSDVFVNFTAAWCVTCQVNERLALRAPQTLAALRRPGLALLKADWTSRDPEITAALERLGRSGVPVYALFSPGKPPRLLATILTPRIVVEALAQKE